MNQDFFLLLGGGATFLIVLFALFWEDSPAKSAAKRFARVSDSTSVVVTKGAASLRRNTADSNIAWIDSIIKTALPNPQKMRERLARTGKTITLGQYMIVNLLSVAIAYTVLSVVWKLGQVESVFLSIGIGLILPHKITGRMGDRRVRKFVASFPEAIDTICRGLRSGLPITETVITVGHEMQDPIKTEFSRVGDAVRMGVPLEEALWDIAPRFNTAEFRFFVVSLAIQRETGGNLAETLGNLSDLLRRRRQLQLKIRAMSSEARASAMIIGSLPFIMFALLYFINRDYIMLMVTTDGGKLMLGGGLAWLSIGIYSMQQMANFEI